MVSTFEFGTDPSTDLSCYPNDHGYFAYTTSEGVPSAVTTTIQEIQPLLTGLSVSDFLSNLSDAVTNTLSPNTQTSDADGDIEMHDCSDFSDNEDEYDWEIHSPQHHEFEDDLSDCGPFSSMEDKEVKAKIREDMRTVKNTGFKTGFLGWLNGPIVISVSCRIAKLGISDEAMQAWGVQPQQYLVLLIRYPNRYRDIDQIFHEDASTSKPSIEMHVALCDSYKPTLAEAMKVFNQGAAERNTPSEGEDLRKLSPSFISRPLNALLNERFVKIAKYRCTFDFGWSGAELFFNDVQGKSLGSADPGDPKYSMEDTLDSSTSGFPKLLTSDHIIENGSPRRLSFPLLAMQFTLRHFVRCTEFCLVCHCKVNAGFEALKPYVCSKALCLYQYMALGFGPSLEWEIISQPNVVDLLVSFTYASAANGRLKDFPTGLGILVPEGTEYLRDLTSSSPSQFTSQGSQYSPSSSSSPTSKSGPRPYQAKLDRKNMELLFPDVRDSPPVRTGDWIVVITHGSFEGPAEIQPHCRVEDTGLWPTVKLSTPIIRGQHPEKWSSTAPKGRAPVFEPVKFVVYDKNFDELKSDQKHAAIVMLLETLPDVEQMKAYLMENKHSSPEPLLASWKEKISKSALDILRWIVASNRSCIIQDDDDLSQSDDVNENLVSGMEGYMQFRFAQGAPDKEQRFVDSVNAATAQFNLKYPTIFAWHGSDPSNWHSIVREGLHFKEVLHGRAYGDGVYMSTSFDVSYGYMGYYSGTPTWPKSKLKISGAISLNEVVNAPSKFVSKNPHLVVNKLDWIQSRYLFVRCLASAPIAPVRKIKPATMFYEQDPSYTAQGPKHFPVVIPITAISQRRRQLVKTNGSNKKTSPTHGTKRTLFGRSARNENDDTGSVETDHEDLLALLSDCEDENDSKIVKTEHGPSKPATGKSSQLKGGLHDPRSPKTNFKPGTLDGSSLPLLAPPSYATISATKALQRDLKTTLKVQDTQPLHELGWYIDPDLISTVYQWIVELHSFDPSIPLAADLKAASLQSVVLELRFSKDYPISPPFVRVIRPRFLPFMAGGGGHVTAGGALCMELLTNTGWSAASSIESVLLQVRMAISSTDPSPARLERSQGKGKVREYAVGEAVDAYVRACRTHGWEIPKDFEQTNRAQWSLASSVTKN